MEAGVRERDQRLLELLTYEVVDGKPIYYRGYKDVLEGKKRPEEVMGSSILQAHIVKVIVVFLTREIEPKGYEVLPHEIGVKVGENWRLLDIGIFRKDEIKEKLQNPTYSEVPPVVAIEVDTKAELENMTFMEYVGGKVEDLFDIGTQRVIWILTKPRIVMVFERGKEGRILTWEDEVEVLEGLRFRLLDLVQP